MNNLVTILMPCYNSEKYIFYAIMSIIEQTYTNWELIIIDDFSNDNSVQIIEQLMLKCTKIQLIKNKMNYGTYFSLNKGLEISKGNFITKLDSDDVFNRNKIFYQINFCIKNNLNVCSCNVIRKYPKFYKKECNVSSILFSRKVFNKIGFYDNVRFDGDSEYYLRIKRYFKIINLNINLYYARYRINSLTSNNETGVNYNTEGIKIRNIYKIYVKNRFNYVNHPKFERKDIILNYKQIYPLEFIIDKKYEYIKGNINLIEIKSIDDNNSVYHVYKISNKNFIINNKNIFSVILKNFINNNKIFIKKNSHEIINNYNYNYIKLEFNLKKGLNKYIPLTINKII